MIMIIVIIIKFDFINIIIAGFITAINLEKFYTLIITIIITIIEINYLVRNFFTFTIKHL